MSAVKLRRQGQVLQHPCQLRHVHQGPNRPSPEPCRRSRRGVQQCPMTGIQHGFVGPRIGCLSPSSPFKKHHFAVVNPLTIL